MKQIGDVRLRIAHRVFETITDQTRVVTVQPDAHEIRYNQLAPGLSLRSGIRARAWGILGMLFMRPDWVRLAMRPAQGDEDIAYPMLDHQIQEGGTLYCARWCYVAPVDTLFVAQFTERCTWAPYHDVHRVH